ncbi:lipase [Pseudonocardia sp. RS11V-5]|uniref:esterase/lipase family protein n=1 Tax=Pseudonocardia terrae TaxID=2905831 RepID=UPI001E51A6C6|nr:lipase [Pseudonocardia terrae]MCE3555933.1 lipase [Pseudonocardia terrae]
MSPRRKALIAVVTVLVLVVAVVVGVRMASSSRPTVDTEARPAQDRPGPVLLVPGYGGSRDSLLRLAARITATGRDAQVLTLVGDGTGDLSAQVKVLDDAATAALAAGAPSVDVVGYSAGGVVAGLWVARDDGAAKARRVVTLGSPLNGTTLAAVAASQAPDACPTACRQLAPGSAELAELARARVGSALPWLSIWTANDETSTPPDTADLPGATDVEVQQVCPGARVTHSGLPTDPTVSGLVLRGIATGPIDLTGAGCGAAAS